MLRIGDIDIFFKSKIDLSYKEELDRLFFFNGNQRKYEEVVEQSIDDYPMPILKEYSNKVAIVFKENGIGQTLHIMDSNRSDAELIGVVMYVRDSVDTITIVHMVLHEECKAILKRSNVNIALIILERLIANFKKLKGIKKVRFYYSDKVLRI